MEETELDTLIEQYGPMHKQLLQFMLRRGSVTVLTFFNKVIDITNGSLEEGQERLPQRSFVGVQENLLVDKLLKCINTEIRCVKLRLFRLDDEFEDNVEYIVLVSQLQSNNLLSSLSDYSSEEKALIRKWLLAFCASYDGEINEIDAINCAEGKVSKKRAQEMIDLLAAGFWLQKTENAALRLGIRGIAELLPCLAETYPVETCSNCGRVLIFKKRAFRCSVCASFIHRQCLLKLCKFADTGTAPCPKKLGNEELCSAALGDPNLIEVLEVQDS